jgi:hypothetical protein
MQPRSEHEQMCRDVRGRLSNILGYLDLLQEAKQSSEEVILKAAAQARAALELIDEFMRNTYPDTSSWKNK